MIRPVRKSSALFALLMSLLFIGISAITVSAQNFTDPGFVSETLATLPAFSPTGAAFAPDGRLFVWQKNGQVRIIKNGTLLTQPFIDISSHVNRSGDRGLMGLAVDPDFATNRFVYLLYVYENTGNPGDNGPKTARLTRVTADANNPDVAPASSEVALMGTIGNAPCSQFAEGSDCMASDSTAHTVGTVRFGPDGKLYVGMGDGSSFAFLDPQSFRAQNLNYYNGKIMRINRDGTAPSDNPFFDGNPNSVRSKIFNYGLRNPFRFTVHPSTGVVMIGDVGLSAWEEINRGRGANFGWPCYEGNDPQPGFQSSFPDRCAGIPASSVTRPIHTYPTTGGASVIGGPFYTGTQFPAKYRGNYFFADYVNNFIRRIVFDANNNVASVEVFATNVPGPVSLEIGPDGALYYPSITTGEIRRIRYNNTTAPIASASATRPSVAEPYKVAFSSAGSSDPNGGTLSYRWEFGDGNTSTQANPVYSYPATGVKTYTARLTVTSSSGLSASDTVTVTVGSRPPVATITAPANNATVNIGDTVTFRGTATDPDETLPASAMSWQVLLHHDTHVHPSITATGSSGSFVVENHGTVGTFFYEIVLTVTDSSGLSSTATVRVNPLSPTSSLPAPWQGTEIGNVGLAGSANYSNGTFTLRGSGADIAGTVDGFYYVYQPLDGDGEIIARVVSVQNTATGAKAGVMIRESTSANAAHALISLSPVEGLAFEWRGATGFGTALTSGGSVAAPHWLRLVRSGSTLTGYRSSDGNTWTQVASATVALPAGTRFGLAVTSANNSAVCTAVFDNVRVNKIAANKPPTVSLTAPTNGATFTAPASVSLAATASDSDGSIAKVEFFSGSQLLATDTQSPYSFNWTNVPSGSYTITARATDNKGATAVSAAVSVTVNPAQSSNKPPTVQLTSPASGSTFTAPARIDLAATASDSDGSVSRVEFYIDGKLLHTESASPYNITWSDVAAGSYSITARAIDNKGAATTSVAVKVTVNASGGTSGSGTGLKGEYFDDDKISDKEKDNQKNLKFTRTDPVIDFNWGSSSPGPGLKKDHFSVRWTGFVQPRFTENYTLKITSADKVRIWINDQLLIDMHGDKDDVKKGRNVGSIRFSAGQKYRIRIEFSDKDKEAYITLRWSSASQREEVIPRSQFYLP
ncbi:MAG: PQQ-dependent sugar dehydrogenase [Blastocatellia bacterium]